MNKSETFDDNAAEVVGIAKAVPVLMELPTNTIHWFPFPDADAHAKGVITAVESTKTDSLPLQPAQAILLLQAALLLASSLHGQYAEGKFQKSFLPQAVLQGRIMYLNHKITLKQLQDQYDVKRKANSYDLVRIESSFLEQALGFSAFCEGEQFSLCYRDTQEKLISFEHAVIFVYAIYIHLGFGKTVGFGVDGFPNQTDREKKKIGNAIRTFLLELDEQYAVGNDKSIVSLLCIVILHDKEGLLRGIAEYFAAAIAQFCSQKNAVDESFGSIDSTPSMHGKGFAPAKFEVINEENFEPAKFEAVNEDGDGSTKTETSQKVPVSLAVLRQALEMSKKSRQNKAIQQDDRSVSTNRSALLQELQDTVSDDISLGSQTSRDMMKHVGLLHSSPKKSWPNPVPQAEPEKEDWYNKEIDQYILEVRSLTEDVEYLKQDKQLLYDVTLKLVGVLQLLNGTIKQLVSSCGTEAQNEMIAKISAQRKALIEDNGLLIAMTKLRLEE